MCMEDDSVTAGDEHGPVEGDANATDATAAPAGPAVKPEDARGTRRPSEVGGPGGPEPTRYGDWERAGRCIDF